MDIIANEKNENEPEIENKEMELGKISVSKDVVAIIVAMEAIKIRGVVGLTAGRKGLSAPILDNNNLTKGIDVTMNQNQKEVAIGISLVVDYTAGIYKVAREAQKNVKKAVETMAGLKVTKVDINVLDVKFEEDIEKEDNIKEVSKEVPVKTKEIDGEQKEKQEVGE